MKTPEGRIAPRWIWAGTVSALVLIALIVSGALWTLLALAGTAAIFIGLFAMLKGSARPFRVRSRRSAGAVLAAGFVVMLIGTSATAASDIEPVSGAANISAPTVAPTETKRSAAPSTKPTPVESEKEIAEESIVPFDSITVDDANSDVGTTGISVGGQDGKRTTTYLVKYRDGVEVSREVLREEVTLEPVTEVTFVGIRQPAPAPAPPAPAPAPAAPAPAPEGGCDSNYADACVPIASDVDCAGGSGNGPAYVSGPVRIVGTDIYDLDRDGDGIACD